MKIKLKLKLKFSEKLFTEINSEKLFQSSNPNLLPSLNISINFIIRECFLKISPETAFLTTKSSFSKITSFRLGIIIVELKD